MRYILLGEWFVQEDVMKLLGFLSWLAAKSDYKFKSRLKTFLKRKIQCVYFKYVMGIIALGKESKNIILCMRKSKYQSIIWLSEYHSESPQLSQNWNAIGRGFCLFISKLALAFISPITDQAFWNNTNNTNLRVTIALVSFRQNQILVYMETNLHQN